MCGEHARAYSIRAKRLGSSPHVRGALPHESTSFYVCGIIPACAGSTADLIKKWAAIRDHPRMCGEHTSTRVNAISRLGSSPHVRGAQDGGHRQCHREGIIPACAGSTILRLIRQPRHRDHPRMCGEHRPYTSSPKYSLGSSPHVRGAHGHWSGKLSHLGIIPACAGSTCCCRAQSVLEWDHPRMCGEH